MTPSNQETSINSNNFASVIKPLWSPAPERIQSATMTAFMKKVNQVFHKKFSTYEELYDWSISEVEPFWETVKDFFSLNFHQEPSRILVKNEVFEKTQWFAGAKLNFAENLLSVNTSEVDLNEQTAIIGVNELGEKVSYTYTDLTQEVSRWVQALRDAGVKPGDRVAGYMPNLPETVIVMLATTAIGGVWSSCSPDFGEQGLKDRFVQINPTVIVTTDGYTYKGKPFVTAPKLNKLIAELFNSDHSSSSTKQKANLTKLVMIPYLHKRKLIINSPNILDPDNPVYEILGADKINELMVSSDDFLKPYNPGLINFISCDFSHPLYILYSSGTTGIPKCIMHGAGHTLVQHVKELGLHIDLQAKDKIFFFTTCGWMMWNWLVSALFFKATVVLYEGNPFHPAPDSLLDMVERESVSVFGSGAQYYHELMKFFESNLSVNIPDPRARTLRTILSTGSPLSKNGFEFIYKFINHDVQLSSISGGTDIVSCFVLGCPILPVYAGEIQCRGLGMAVEVVGEEGNAVVGKKGELICRNPFPAMPIGFFADPDGVKYHNAYFAAIPNVWCHGDYAEITARGGVIIYGRSDTTLNPGGVRIGTAEIYRSIEVFPEIESAAAIGYQQNGQDEEVKVVLMIKTSPEKKLSNSNLTELYVRIRKIIRKETTPRHVPSYIVRVPDIPRTISGKISEKAITDIVNKREHAETKNTGALANPECLDFYRELIRTQSITTDMF